MESLASLVKQRVDRIVVENETLKAGFAALPYLVMKDKVLTLGARMTYAFLLMYAWQEGSCFAGQEQMATEMGISRAQLQRYLYELRDTHYIRIERIDKRYNNTYILLDTKPAKLKAIKQSKR